MGVDAAAVADVRNLENSTWLDRGVRLGLVVYGVVHLIIALTAVQLAFGCFGLYCFAWARHLDR